MTREEKQKTIDALKISAPIMAVTQEEFNDYIQTLNKVMDWLEQESTIRNCVGCKYSKDNHNAGIEECHLCMWENQYTPTTKNDLVLLEKTYADFCNCEGGEGWLKIDGKEYFTDVGYALEGMSIFMEVFKQRLAETEAEDEN